MSGFLITFEGGEGSSKTTQIQCLVKWLKRCFPHKELVSTREPGGTDDAELIRELLVQGASNRWHPATEAMLMSASRHEHVKTVIEPALARGALVISDRFFDSTTVYQGVVGGVDAEAIAALKRLACGAMVPHLTFLLDIDVEVGLDRVGNRGDGETRFEKKGLDYHQKVRAAFLQLAEAHKDRIVVVDATQTSADIAKIVRDRVMTLASLGDAV